ncbi:tRNA (N6-threonylcarbamoyladenosine(37)-N6)-methyltransferase TrmO [Tianweitania sp. Rool2]|uniref:tRNA (N6-threonylcarbamoyladenosine(37)-N6)-methyltransferase TrmO n=2 Tax=Oryzicola mucosus TaxID=2767425 RepID=A0A8J6U4N5_9HYPH|nr:tRNA (N6-threonylcarbamoyladenosine(37)-N6)-methyltransferase TrmO [Oryzicola mucosus]
MTRAPDSTEPAFGPREGEVRLERDPAQMAPDASVVFIGHVVSPWKLREECPKNMRAARETGKAARVQIDSAYRPGLAGLERASHAVVLTWLDRSPRNLIVQKPRHAADVKGVFGLRSPARPNPIGLHVARLLSLDIAAGILEIDAIDVLDGTPIVDLKPYMPSIDAFPDAVVDGREGSR